MVQIIKSLSASTKVSSKLRPLVTNPDPRSKEDARMARLGVFKYSPKKGKHFSPIKGTGEYGAAIRYINRNEVLMRVAGGWKTYTRQELTALEAGSHSIQNHKRRIIGRSGLAKSSWAWVLGKLGASGKSNQAQIAGSTNVKRIKQDNFTDLYIGIEADNRIGYIRKAFAGGREPVSTALARAVGNMRYDMGEVGKAAKSKAGL